MTLEQINPKNPQLNHCNLCDYYTSNKKDYKKHISTRKHQNKEKSNQIEQNRTENSEKSHSGFVCIICDKSYLSKSGLWNHKKKCSQKPLENTLTITDINNPSIIMNLIKENQEFKSLLIEQQKLQLEQQKENKELINKVIELSREPRIINHGTMTQNNNQKHFNLQFFLNDTCKDAITLQQFIENIQVSLEDLENVGKNGYLKGISDIFINKLNTLDITKRPIHCTDVKREVIYLKEEDAWNKDDKDNTKLKNAIRTVEDKNWNKIPEWQRENPNVIHSDTPEYVMRDKIMRNIAGNDNMEKLRNKMVKVLAKETQLDKCDDPSIMDTDS
jgi:hypothetical protein